MDLLDTQIFPLVGEEGFARLVSAFYRRVPADEVLGPMYRRDESDGSDGSDGSNGNGRNDGSGGGRAVDLSAAEGRLRDFLIQRFGGPGHYSQRRGHPRLRMRHNPFAIDQAARDRWISLMEQALAEAVLPPQAEVVLRRFFHESATFLVNR